MPLLQFIQRHRPRLASPNRLRSLGILGMNARNHRYVQSGNPPKLVKDVDDKLTTKKLCETYGIATPTLAGAIGCQHEVKHLDRLLNDLPDFAIKPARGSGGRGILVITKAREGEYQKNGGTHVSLGAIRAHVSNILAGLYSLGGVADVAVVERCIKFSDAFERYSYQGVPDIRIVVYRGYPVMAMMRCSTKKSDGKANLHQGAVGVGIDLASGCAIAAVQHNRTVDRHPDTGAAFDELKAPEWQKHLELATTAFEMTGLSYIGADIVLDRERGPMVLELNARPGLAIQTANLCGLAHRLEAIAKLPPAAPPPEERIKLAQQMFSLSEPSVCE